MLRKQNQPKMVSSVFLWQEIYETTYADKPWQKLKNHILLVLQILAILLLVLALMAPQIPWGQGYYKNVIFVVDQSASMNANISEKREAITRLDAAKEWMRDYINQAGEHAKGYIVTAGSTATLTLAGSSQKQTLLSAIDQIEPSYGRANLEEGIQIAKALGESLEEAYEIVVLTDQKLERGLDTGRYIYFGESGLNGAITLMAHQVTEKGITILMQAANKGNETYSGDISLYGCKAEQGKEELLDVQEILLNEGESTTLHFNLPNVEDITSKYDYFKGELSVKDALEADNCYYYVQNQAQGRKVLLVTEGNVFLEKVLMTLEDCEVYKTTDLSLLESDENYDLYVLDRQTVETWPKSGNVLLVGCDTSGLLESSQVTQNQQVQAKAENLPNYLQSLSFVVGEVTSYELPYWGKSILQAGDKSVGFIGEKEGQKVGVLGFDLWDSDFVLKTDFPLLMYYIGDALLDTARVSKNNVTSDESITLRQNALEETLTVWTLSGKKIDLKQNVLNPSTYLGIYQVEVKHSDATAKERILLAVNYPTDSESDLANEVIGEDVVGQASSLRDKKSLTPYLIVLLLGVVLAEWYFYRKGY